MAIDDLRLEPGWKSKLEDALVDAFRDKYNFRRLVQGLGFEAHEFETGTSIRQMIGSLVDECGARGHGRALVEAATRLNSGNPLLRKVAGRLLGAQPATETESVLVESPGPVVSIPKDVRGALFGLLSMLRGDKCTVSCGCAAEFARYVEVLQCYLDSTDVRGSGNVCGER